MSYDLVVFDPQVAPRGRDEFLRWYDEQTAWPEGHSYDDPEVTTPALASWFADMSQGFPPMNGALASNDYANLKVTDYAIGRSVIYAAFASSQGQLAYETVRRLAAKHSVGFFDASGDGEIAFPNV